MGEGGVENRENGWWKQNLSKEVLHDWSEEGRRNPTSTKRVIKPQINGGTKKRLKRRLEEVEDNSKRTKWRVIRLRKEERFIEANSCPKWAPMIRMSQEFEE